VKGSFNVKKHYVWQLELSLVFLGISESVDHPEIEKNNIVTVFIHMALTSVEASVS